MHSYGHPARNRGKVHLGRRESVGILRRRIAGSFRLLQRRRYVDWSTCRVKRTDRWTHAPSVAGVQWLTAWSRSGRPHPGFPSVLRLRSPHQTRGVPHRRRRRRNRDHGKRRRRPVLRLRNAEGHHPVAFAGSFQDPAKGYEIASQMLLGGIDYIQTDSAATDPGIV